LKGEDIYAVCMDDDNNIWVGGNQKMWKIDAGGNVFKILENTIKYSLFLDQKN